MPLDARSHSHLVDALALCSRSIYNDASNSDGRAHAPRPGGRGTSETRLRNRPALRCGCTPLGLSSNSHCARRLPRQISASIKCGRRCRGTPSFAERTQLRLQNPREVDADDDLHRSAARGGAVLQHAAEAALAQRGLDAYHDASSAWRRLLLSEIGAVSVPGAQGPGLVTVIAEDAPGSRCATQTAPGGASCARRMRWPSSNGLAKIAGHPACVHRVVPCAERVSITFELGLNEAGVRAAAAAERARLLGDAGAGSPPGCAVM